MNSPECRSRLIIPIQLHAVQLETRVSFPEFLPGRLLMLVKMIQVVKLVAKIEQVLLQRDKPIDELFALTVPQEWIDQRQPLGDLLLTRVLARVG